MCTAVEHKCATRSITQLVQWFNKHDRERLDRLGFVLRVYDIPALIKSDDYQVSVYIRKYQRAVATHSLTDVLVGA